MRPVVLDMAPDLTPDVPDLPEPSQVDMAPKKTPPKEATPPPSRKVRISIASVPANAKVEVNGKPAGLPPLRWRTKRDDAPLRVRVSKFGWGTQTLTIRPNKDKKLKVQLQKHRIEMTP